MGAIRRETTRADPHRRAPGAGKTTLVEALLAHTDYMITAVVRCMRDDTLPQPCESLARTDPELHRYRMAGGHTVARYAFPGTSDAHDAFFQSDLMQDLSHAVVIEGDCPVSFADVSAFISPATGGRLLVRRKSDQPSRQRQAMDALEAVLSRPGAWSRYSVNSSVLAWGSSPCSNRNWWSGNDGRPSPSWRSYAADRWRSSRCAGPWPTPTTASNEHNSSWSTSATTPRRTRA